MIFFLFLSQAFAKNSPAIFPLAQTDKGEVYVTFNDINQMKIMFLIFALSGLIGIIKWGVGLFTRTEQKSREGMDRRLLELEKNDKDILNAIQRLEIHLAHVKDDQVKSDEVRSIVRNEFDYLHKLKDKKA
jgi:hypothetical protein